MTDREAERVSYGQPLLAEVLAADAAARAASHVDVTVSLPADLVYELRAAAAAYDQTVGEVLVTILRQTLASSAQQRLDRSLDLDAASNEAWARDAIASTARAWKDLEW